MLKLFAAVLVAGTLSACLFGEDKDDSNDQRFTMSGVLADLDTLPPSTPDSGGPTYSAWFLPVDTTALGEVREANCFYTGYLGTETEKTYTNDLMSGERTMTVLRQEGLTLYRETTQPTHTHYEVIFTCVN
jgi:hypothetical protein